jgi:hypothetical protein
MDFMFAGRIARLLVALPSFVKAPDKQNRACKLHLHFEVGDQI